MNKKKYLEFLKYFVISSAILILAVFLLWKYEITIAFFTKLFKILRPLIIGGAIAFILNRPVVKFQKLYKGLFDKSNTPRKNGKPKTFYTLSIITAYVIFVAIVTAIIWFIIPQLFSSAKFFVSNFDGYYKNFVGIYNKYLGSLDLSLFKDTDILDTVYTKIYSLTEYIPEFLTKTFGVTAGIISGVVDVFIGLIFSVYLIADKKKLKSQVSKVFRVILSDNKYNKLVDFYNLTSKSFSHFINGQLTEAFILGILCFVGMKIFGFEYAVLISVIIGVTNLIPIFGPIFGTIPCALILLLVNPIHALWFVVFIIVLQQIDSNIIYPRVVGNSVGLGPLWTLAAIIIGGGLFGVLGMLLSVPTMSVIYILVGRLVNKKYKEKNDESSNPENKQEIST